MQSVCNITTIDELRYVLKKSDAYLKQKQYSNAMVYYYHILRITGLSISTASSLLSKQTGDQYRLYALQCIAYIYFSTKQYAKCVDKCNVLLRLLTNSSINDCKILYFRGISLYHLCQPYKALKDLTKVYSVYPTNHTRKLMNKLQVRLLQQIDSRSHKPQKRKKHHRQTSMQLCSRKYIQRESCLYKLVEIPFCGSALVANQNICKGCIILTDKPLIVYDNDKDQKTAEQNVLNAYDSLNKLEREQYNKLYSRDWIFAAKNKTIEIANTNAIMLSYSNTDERNRTSVCPLISRINHSCLRNAHWIWNEEENKVLLIASRDIVEGEQLFTSYLGSQLFSKLQNNTQRREYLLHHYGFYCECELCTNIDERQCAEMEHIHKEWNEICQRLLKSTTETIGSMEELLMASKFVKLSKKYYSCFGERLIISYEQMCARFIAHKQYNDAFKYFKKVLIEKALYNGHMHIEGSNFEQTDSEIMSWINLFPSAFQCKINHLLQCRLMDVI